MKEKIFIGAMVAIIVGSLGFTLYNSRIFEPLKKEEIENKKYSIELVYTVYIEPSSKLNKTCYSGSIDDSIENREYYIGVLNYLCGEYKLKNIRISTDIARGSKLKNNVLAGASGLYGITFFSNTIEEFNPSQFDIAHVICHEYIHLLMFREMANAYTVNDKSKQLIDSVADSYIDLPEYALYPTEYAKTKESEQIAEILGIYMARRMYTVKNIQVGSSNFEIDLYNQFMLNIRS